MCGGHQIWRVCVYLSNLQTAVGDRDDDLLIELGRQQSKHRKKAAQISLILFYEFEPKHLWNVLLHCSSLQVHCLIDSQLKIQQAHHVQKQCVKTHQRGETLAALCAKRKSSMQRSHLQGHSVMFVSLQKWGGWAAPPPLPE